ncbi:MAG: SIS domain-containing protein [Pseudolysinimonas sp.]
MNSEIAAGSAGREYLKVAERLIARLASDEWAQLRSAAELVATAVEAGRTVHAFGTGHGHMLAEELFYRAGGLVRVRPILFEGLMLHASGPLSTALERLPGLAAAVLDDHHVVAGDVMIVASNSGGNAVVSEMVQLAQQRGLRVIAITSVRHATSPSARPTGFARIHELADVVIDNGGAVGDAAVHIDGFERAVAPTSTVVGAAVLNAVIAEAVQIMVESGVTPDVYESSNTAGGDATNAPLNDAARQEATS